MLLSGLGPVPACAQTAAPATAAVPVGERGGARSTLLLRLLGGNQVILLKQTSHQPDVTDPLRLDEAVAFALANNFEVQAAGAKTDAADWDVAGAYGAYLPTVSISRSSGRERSQPASYSVDDVRVKDSTHHRRDKQFSVLQPVVDLTLISDILLRHKSQAAAEIEEVGVRERVALQTIGAYLKIVQAHLAQQFAEEYKSQLDKLTEFMTSRVEGGGAAQADLDRIKARAVAAQSAIIESRSEFDAAMDEFRRLTGITPLKLQIPASLVPTPPTTVDEAMTRALRFGPEYLLATKQAEVQEQESDKAYSRMLPKVNFEFSRSRSWNAGGSAMGVSASGGDDVYPYQNEQRAMLTAVWTLNGASELAQGLSAGAKAREANYRAMDTRARVEEAVRVTYNALAAAQSRVPVLEQATESNARVVTAFEEQYMNASRPLFDLLDAYERSYLSRLDLTRVLIAEAQAGHQLRRQMGELVAALLETEPRAHKPGQKRAE